MYCGHDQGIHFHGGQIRNEEIAGECEGKLPVGWGSFFPELARSRKHSFIKLYRRPWKKLFRREIYLKCIRCQREWVVTYDQDQRSGAKSTR